MNKRQLLQLCRVNLLYASPQTTTNARKRGKSGKVVINSILRQYLLMTVLFMFIYGATMVMTNFKEKPGYFTYYIALFTVLGLSQSVSSIFNVFFQSKDMKDYLPLPFKNSEVFLAKFLVVALSVLPFLLPTITALLMAGVRGSLGIVSVPLAIVVFMLFFFLLFSLSTLLVFGLTQLPFYQKNQKLFSSILLFVPYILMLVAIFALSFSNGASTTAGQQDRPIISLFMPMYQIMINPLTLAGVISFGGLLLLTALCVLAVFKLIVPRLFDANLWLAQNTGQKKAHRRRNLSQSLKSYNFGLLKDPALIMQSLSNSLIMPIIMLISTGVAIRHMIPDNGLPLTFTGVCVLAGIVFALMTINQTAFVSNIISLDRENFVFVRSLPISFRNYLALKFKITCGLQLLICEVLLLGASLFIGLNIFLTLALMLGGILGVYFSSSFYFVRDYRLLLVNWTNLSQLFTRGAGNFGLMLAMFGTLFLGSIAVIAYAAAVVLMPSVSGFINGIFAFVLIVVTVILKRHYKKTFWQHLE